MICYSWVWRYRQHDENLEDRVRSMYSFANDDQSQICDARKTFLSAALLRFISVFGNEQVELVKVSITEGSWSSFLRLWAFPDWSFLPDNAKIFGVLRDLTQPHQQSSSRNSLRSHFPFPPSSPPGSWFSWTLLRNFTRLSPVKNRQTHSQKAPSEIRCLLQRPQRLCDLETKLSALVSFISFP